MAGRIWLPPVEGGVAAGVTNPLRITKWKIGALRICAELRRRGHVTRLDFEAHGIDIRRWVSECWIVRDGDVPVLVNGKAKRLARYVQGKVPLFDETHPELAAALAAEGTTT